MNLIGISISFCMVLVGIYFLLKKKRDLEVVRKHIKELENINKKLENVETKGEKEELETKIREKMRIIFEEIRAMEEGLMQSKALRELEENLSNF